MSNPSWLIEGEWPSPLLDCFAAGPSVCIISLCCPCIQYGFNVHNLSVKLQARPSEQVKISEISCFKAGLTYTCYSFCGSKFFYFFIIFLIFDFNVLNASLFLLFLLCFSVLYCTFLISTKL